MNTITIEEDGDEIFIPISEVKCCLLRWENEVPIYSKIVKTPSHLANGTFWWWCCDKCGLSYGEVRE